jgi:hypothetical protein
VADLIANEAALVAGRNVRTFTIGGRTIEYHAYRLPSDAVNVGRVTIP